MNTQYYRSGDTFFKQIDEKIWSITFGQKEWNNVFSIHYDKTKELFTENTKINQKDLPIQLGLMDSVHSKKFEQEKINDFIDLCEKESSLNTVIAEYAGYDYLAPALEKMMEGNDLLIELLKKKKEELGLEDTYGEI